MMRSELIEWVVTCLDKRTGAQRIHSEGAQTVFGLTRARKVAKALGAPWEVRKRATLEPSEEK